MSNLKLALTGLSLHGIGWLGVTLGGTDASLFGLFMVLGIGGFGMMVLAALRAPLARTGVSGNAATLAACGLMIAQGFVVSQFEVFGIVDIVSSFMAGAGWFFLALWVGVFAMGGAAALRRIKERSKGDAPSERAALT